MTEIARAIIVDDHELFRDGLSQLLDTEPTIEVVATGKNGEEAVSLTKEHQPDVLVLDVEMPGQTVDVTLEQLKQVAPAVKVIIVTMHEDGPLIQRLLEAGAAAFLVKTVGRQDLVSAVRSVWLQDRDIVTVAAPRAVMQSYENAPHEAQGSSSVSERELEVLALVAQACSNADIARTLFITEGTVKRHLNNVYRKLGAKSRMDAVHKASEQGILNSS